MEQIVELFFIPVFGIRSRRPCHAQSCLLQNAHDVICPGIPPSAETRHQLSADLLDLGRCEPRFAHGSRCFKNQRFFRGGIARRLLVRTVGAQGFLSAGVFLEAGSVFAPIASRRLSRATLRLCSASVRAKECPPWSLATKYR